VQGGEASRASGAIRHYLIHAMIPLFRVVIRYGLGRTWREHLWWRIVEPYICWHRHSFVCRTRFGARFGGDTGEILQQHVYYFGAWELDLTAWIAGKLQPGDVMIDVGANVGYFSLLGSRLVGEEGAVVAIEPSPAAYELLTSNLGRNVTENVRAVKVAAAERKGTLSLFAGHEAHRGLASVVANQGTGVEAEVAAAPLDAVVGRAEMERTRLVKIDVEGAEWSVVAGLGELWECAREDLEVVVEVHPEQLAHSGKQVEDVIDLFAERGFRPYRLHVDYSPSPYLSREAPTRATRVHGRVDYEAHLVFSRRDAEQI
jgi:FkbM family methyltransferase